MDPKIENIVSQPKEKKELAQAMVYLKGAREGKAISMNLEYMKGCLREAKGDLVDIGTNEDEINNLRKNGNIADAKIMMDKVRNSKNNMISAYVLMEQVRFMLTHDNLTLEDIGTNEEEIDSMIDKDYVTKLLSEIPK